MQDDNFNFCGLKANLTIDLQTPARLPRCRWWLDNTLPRWQRDDVRAVLNDALGVWAKVADVQVEEAKSADLADLLIRCVPLDGSYGVLADCELPGPRLQHLRIDTSEQWTYKLGPDVPAGLIDLDRVVRHEGGHFWGMGHHTPVPNEPSIMDPVYSKTVWEPTGWEIDQMQKAYGPPKPGVPPTPPPPVPGDPIIVKIFGASRIEVNGQPIPPKMSPVTTE